MATGYEHYAGTKGSKLLHVGVDPTVYLYTTIQSAIDAAKDGDTVLIEPGTWTLTAQLTCYKPINLVANGGPVYITSALTTATVDLNVPATYASATYTFRAQDIIFACTGAGGDAVNVDNDGGAAVATVWNFINCSFTSTGGGGYALVFDQTTDTVATTLNIVGNPVKDSMGISAISLTRAGSVSTIDGMRMTDVLEYGTTDVAAIYNFINGLYDSDAQTSGGAASIITNQVGLMRATLAGAATAGTAAGDDFDANAATETWVPFA